MMKCLFERIGWPLRLRIVQQRLHLTNSILLFLLQPCKGRLCNGLNVHPLIYVLFKLNSLFLFMLYFTKCHHNVHFCSSRGL